MSSFMHDFISHATSSKQCELFCHIKLLKATMQVPHSTLHSTHRIRLFESSPSRVTSQQLPPSPGLSVGSSTTLPLRSLHCRPRAKARRSHCHSLSSTAPYTLPATASATGTGPGLSPAIGHGPGVMLAPVEPPLLTSGHCRPATAWLAPPPGGTAGAAATAAGAGGAAAGATAAVAGGGLHVLQTSVMASHKACRCK